MRVRQHVYLGVYSETLDPEVISARLGMYADESHRKGSRRGGLQPVPRNHMVKISSGVPNTRGLDEHFEAIEKLLASHGPAIKNLVLSGEVTARIQVVRHFEPGAEDPVVLGPYEIEDSVHGTLTQLGGQHTLLGFGLRGSLVVALADLGLDLDFDEYGDEEE